ncbi:tRNA lysidine(34) synthetase TilS [Frateuria sp. YIM B11624]|uniref:tRNA lysidine(34) synthetase TilS n=1 Tax=Frateuria sp. YIM B11624 TaxID=3143185 RepID=UPI003C72B26B
MSSSRTLPDALRHALDAHPDGPLCVAFSGGPDSTALLHALAALPQARARGLRALHVDHGLCADSGEWAAQARTFCARLDITCEVAQVDVPRESGEGLEAAARHVRYAAFARAIQPGEWLLLGHHRDDQAETVLLKLLRGAGPQGLGGMRATRALGAGWLWRPLLDLPREVLRAYVQAHRLPCVDDPSNRDTALARNHLRHEILPRLQRYFPHAVDSILHSAALCRAADGSLRRRWLEALDVLHDPATGSLDANGWLALESALREPLLDHWLHARGLGAPTAAQRRQIERQCAARAGQQPCVRWRGTELHIWKGRLWALAPRAPVDPQWQADWHGEPLELPDGGTLVLDPPARLAAPLTVRLRRGGERIRPAGDRHTRELRDLFQQAALPPWRRQACPLLYAGGELIAVADLWQTERAASLFEGLGARLCWRPARQAERDPFG